MRRAVPVIALLFSLTACDSEGGDSTDTDAATSTSGTTQSPTPTTSGGTSSGDPDPDPEPGSSSTSADPTTGGGEESSSSTTGGSGLVVMETTMGTITIEVFDEQSPITAANFHAYIESGFYDGSDGLEPTVFHRVIPEFMIQGGGLTEALQDKATMPPIVNEHDTNGLTNDRGTLAMARTNDPNSATSQFFINVADNDFLDESPGYAVFGQVVEGMDVVDAIVAVPRGNVGGFMDVPNDPITITSVYVE